MPTKQRADARHNDAEPHPFDPLSGFSALCRGYLGCLRLSGPAPAKRSGEIHPLVLFAVPGSGNRDWLVDVSVFPLMMWTELSYAELTGIFSGCYEQSLLS